MRELWGTFSVRDHCEPRPFVADVMLYDRLVVPYPPDRAEWERWETERGWNPERQRRVLDVLRKHDLTVEVPWDARRRDQFQTNYAAAQAAGHEALSGYAFTAGQLLSDQKLDEVRTAMPVRPNVVAAYVSREAMMNEAPFEPLDEGDAEDAVEADAETRKQELALLLGREFLVPDEAAPPSEELDLELLGRAARLASQARFKEKRSAFHSWLDRAVAERYTNKEALKEMDRLLRDYNGEVKRAGITTRVEQAFLVAGTGLTIAGHFFPPLWLGAILVAPARYLALKQLPGLPLPDRPAAMFHEVGEALSTGRLH